MKRVKCVVIVAVVLTIAFSCVLFKIESDKKRMRVDTERGFVLLSSLTSRDFETAKKYFDTLRANGRDNEIFYLQEGWMYDMLNEKDKAKKCFLKSLKLQEEKIDTMKKSQSRDVELVQRAMLIQALYGDEAHERSLDSLRGKLCDSTFLDFGRSGMAYNKERMFNGRVYKDEQGWHVEFVSSNESSSSWYDESTDKKKGEKQDSPY